jgi:hypothetical protein
MNLSSEIPAFWPTVNTGEVREGPADLGLLRLTGWMLRCVAKHFELIEGLSPQASAEAALTRYHKRVFESLRAACLTPEGMN